MHLSKRLIVLLLMLLYVGTVSARALGGTQPANMATAGFTEGCSQKPQPCWYGITPGITNGGEAFRLLGAAGFTRTSITPARYGDEAHVYTNSAGNNPCKTILQYNANSQHIQRIQLDCEGVQLGDMIAAKGIPTGIQKTTGYAARLLFAGNISAIEAVAIDTTSLFSPLRFLDLRAASISADEAPTFRWHGLAPFWRYCALEFALICATETPP